MVLLHGPASFFATFESFCHKMRCLYCAEEGAMWKLVVTGVAACLLTASQLVYAQNASTAELPRLLSDADLKALTDRSVEVLKFALALTPDQAKYWPAVEAPG